MRHKLFLLLLSSWLIVIVESEIVSEMLNDMYSKLDPNAPYEEKKNFYPISTADYSSSCPEGQFKDRSVGDRYGQDYCFLIPQLALDSRGRQRIPVIDEKFRLVGCDNSVSCLIRVEDTISVCDLTTGYKYKEFNKDVDGICIKSEGVAYVYTEIYNNLPLNTPIEEKKKYLPVSYGSPEMKKCYKHEECDKGQFCGEADNFPNDDPHFYSTCYYLPKLVDSNNEGPIIIALSTFLPRGLPVCSENNDCLCFHDDCENVYTKCFLKTGLKFVGRYSGKKVVNGICIKANPIAYILSDIYFNLNDDVTYEERRKYFPVGYVDLKHEMDIKNCSMNKECADGQFCGTVYGYVRDEPKINRKQNDDLVMYCFTVPQLPNLDNIPRIIPIVPDETDIELCSSIVRCKADESWRCDKGTGSKYVKKTLREDKVVYDGICVKEHPVSYAFSEQYKNLNNDVAFEERKKYFPVDYEGLSQVTLLKKCTMNSECADGEFCGAVYDSTDNAPKQNVYYCFAIPQFPDLNGLPRIVALIPTEKDLVLCDSDSDCNVWRCDLATGEKFVEERTKKVKNGICEKAPPVAYVFSEMYLNLGTDATYEEKKKYFPDKYDSASDQCASHSNCDADKFCGAILDFTINLPKNRYYCFALPQLSELKNGPRIVGKPASHNLALCNQNSDCVSDELWKCDLETGLTLAGEVGGKRELFNGVCIKAPPVALVFSDTYLNFSPDVSYEEKRKFFAVDYVEPNQNLALKTCSSNKDCDEGQFCDQVLDFTNNLAKQGRTHCFAIPTIPAPFHESTKITIQPDKSGLMLCNEPTDCGSDLFCNIETGQKYVKSKEEGNENVEYNGVCMKDNIQHTEICQVNEHNEQFKWSYGTSPSNSKISCDSDEDCAGTRDTADSIFQSYCVLKEAFNNVNLCCHRKTQPCKMGKLVGPAVRCGKNEGFKDGIFAECNGGLEKMGKQGEKADKWCDEGNNQCCQDQTNDKIQYCPDGQTPLFNEPKCRDYDENKPDSGKCIDKIGSICKNGHCCPDVKTDAQGKLIRNKYSYLTNHPCVPGIRPPQFPAGYCEPESRKVVIFGELSPLNDTLTRWPEDYPKVCQKDSDCSSDNSTLCIYNDEGYCYYNPMKHVPIQSSNVVIIIGIIIGIIILISAIVGVTVWMLMRKKKNLVKPAAVLKSPSAQTLSKSIDSKVSAESVSGMKTPTANSVI